MRTTDDDGKKRSAHLSEAGQGGDETSEEGDALATQQLVQWGSEPDAEQRAADVGRCVDSSDQPGVVLDAELFCCAREREGSVKRAV